jgi:hypothetical protein
MPYTDILYSVDDLVATITASVVEAKTGNLRVHESQTDRPTALNGQGDRR